MTKPVIVTRATKGSALTWTEGDANFTNLQDATITLVAGTGGTNVVSDLNGTVTLVAGTNITLTGDNTAKTITIDSSGGGGGLTDVVDDTSPQLGGNLDTNGNNIVTVSNADLVLAPDGTGDVQLQADVFVGRSNVNAQISTNGTGDLILNTNNNLDSGNIVIYDGADGDITITPNGTGSVIIDGNEFPQTQGAVGEVLTADGSGLVEWKLNQTLSVQVYNAESTDTINKGEPVYVFGAQGSNISVKRAINTGDSTSAQTLGLANENITAGSTGIVICQGLLKNVDTSTPGYTAGQALYLGNTAGSVTTTKPYAPNHLVYLGFVETVNSVSGRIYVRTQNGYELDEIHDVNINHNVASADKDYLVYNSSLSLWENRQLDIVNDTTPQLGGNLDLNNNSIVSASNNDITIEPNGTGHVKLKSDVIDIGDLNADATVTTNGTGDLILNTNAGSNSGTIRIYDGSNGNIEITPNGTGKLITDYIFDSTSLTLEGGPPLSNSGTITLDGTKITINPGTGYTEVLGNLKMVGNELTVGVSNTNATITTNGTGDLILNTNGGFDSGKIQIEDAANGNIQIVPSGSGKVYIDSDTLRLGDANAAATITSNGTGNLVLNTNSGTNSGNITINQGANGLIQLTPNGTGAVIASVALIAVQTSTTNLSSPLTGRNTVTSSGTTGRPSVLVQKHRSNTTIASMTDEPAVLAFGVRDSASANRQFASQRATYTGTGANPIMYFDVSTDNYTTTVATLNFNDTRAVWGNTNTNYTLTTNGTGNLTLNTNSGTNSGSILINQGANANISITPNGTGQTKVTNLNYNEVVYTSGSTTGTITPDVANGTIQSITLTGNITFNAFSNPVSGQTITLIITQPSSGGPYTLTSTMKFAGASNTLSTAANAVDILTVSYIGTTYYATLSKGYA